MIKQITVVIPVLNEARFIAKCLDSVKTFALPDGWNVLEVLALDGGSTDDTVSLIKSISWAPLNVFVLQNPGRIQSTALNLAISRAAGEYLLRLDAHAIYPSDYLVNCVRAFESSSADNVGGVFVACPGGHTYGALMVQAVTTHSFGIGNAGFRLGESAGRADTVPYGFFKRELFSKIGLFDERLLRAQDYELNRRIAEAGGFVWRDPKIQVNYFNQPSMTEFLGKQLSKEAPYNAYMWYLAPYSFAWRHAITGFFALGVIAGLVLWPINIIRYTYLAVLALYLALAVASAVQQSIRYSEWRHAFALPFAFFAYHFIHGVGVLCGLARLVLRSAPVQKIREPWSGAGQFRAWSPPDKKSWGLSL